MAPASNLLVACLVLALFVSADAGLYPLQHPHAADRVTGDYKCPSKDGRQLWFCVCKYQARSNLVSAGGRQGRPSSRRVCWRTIVYRVQVWIIRPGARSACTCKAGEYGPSVPLLQQQGEVSIRHEQYAGRNLASCGDAAVGICPVEIHAALMCSLRMLIWRDTYP